MLVPYTHLGGSRARRGKGRVTAKGRISFPQGEQLTARGVIKWTRPDWARRTFPGARNERRNGPGSFYLPNDWASPLRHLPPGAPQSPTGPSRGLCARPQFFPVCIHDLVLGQHAPQLRSTNKPVACLVHQSTSKPNTALQTGLSRHDSCLGQLISTRGYRQGVDTPVLHTHTSSAHSNRDIPFRAGQHTRAAGLVTGVPGTSFTHLIYSISPRSLQGQPSTVLDRARARCEIPVSGLSN